MENRLITYITSELMLDSSTKIELDEDLLSSGILDSLSTMKLIAYIEKTFEIKVAPEDMVIEHFLDINSIVQFIKTKQS